MPFLYVYLIYKKFQQYFMNFFSEKPRSLYPAAGLASTRILKISQTLLRKTQHIAGRGA